MRVILGWLSFSVCDCVLCRLSVMSCHVWCVWSELTLSGVFQRRPRVCSPSYVLWFWASWTEEQRRSSTRSRAKPVRWSRADVHDGPVSISPVKHCFTEVCVCVWCRGSHQADGRQGLSLLSLDDLHHLCGVLRGHLPFHWTGQVSLCHVHIKNQL